MTDNHGLKGGPSNWQPCTDPLVLAIVGKAIEEASELSKCLARIVIQGPDGADPRTGESNLDALFKELSDLRAAGDHLKNYFNRDIDHRRVAAKYQHKQDWHDMIRAQHPSALDVAAESSAMLERASKVDDG